MKSIKCPYAVPKVVGQNELESWTMQGWRLVFTAQEVEFVPQHRSYPQAANQGFVPTGMENVPVKVTRYVLGKDENSTLAVVQTELTQTKVDLDRASKEVFRQTTKLNKVDLELAQTKDASNDFQRLSNDRKLALTEAEKRNRVLEGDLAKVRQAIGELKMKEITGR